MEQELEEVKDKCASQLLARHDIGTEKQLEQQVERSYNHQSRASARSGTTSHATKSSCDSRRCSSVSWTRRQHREVLQVLRVGMMTEASMMAQIDVNRCSALTKFNYTGGEHKTRSCEVLLGDEAEGMK